jgi:hypothetical protein
MNKINHKTLCILLDYIYIFQDDTRSIQYQVKSKVDAVHSVKEYGGNGGIVLVILNPDLR